jgi:hypothetical protein
MAAMATMALVWSDRRYLEGKILQSEGIPGRKLDYMHFIDNKVIKV